MPISIGSGSEQIPTLSPVIFSKYETITASRSLARAFSRALAFDSCSRRASSCLRQSSSRATLSSSILSSTSPNFRCIFSWCSTTCLNKLSKNSTIGLITRPLFSRAFFFHFFLDSGGRAAVPGRLSVFSQGLVWLTSAVPSGAYMASSSPKWVLLLASSKQRLREEYQKDNGCSTMDGGESD
ncbi:type-2 restriction enzyme CfrBI [Striga asiatica]|uniref:Type-2 restriction enzyme CfrBI n=1 Tax=Striga asiatica TaxID=4170 RepID=A0A5A7R5N3_STRAF|nr:type-2 restriction enzyme CfrBI [Striga asiatica]